MADGRLDEDQTLALETGGYSQLPQRIAFPRGVQERLPAACDRFEEARHFLWLTVNLPADGDHLARANWYAGAHIAAVIGIQDAAKADYRRRKGPDRDYRDSILLREF